MRLIVALALLVWASACSKPKSATTPLVFSRPEHIGFVCLDPGALPDKPHRLVRPLRCCAARGVLAPDDSQFNMLASSDCKGEGEGEGETDTWPILHGLITQSTRGEVAAVDLSTNKVIDSNLVIPGYTFVDVGGIPSAIVVPPAKILKDGETWTESQTEGAPFTYVASAEELHVRAVATCHFGDKGECGPELGRKPALSEDDVRVPLPSAPRDMLLADGALWITLPDLALLARVQLPAGTEGEKYEEPFALDDAGTRLPPTFFAIPSIGEVEPPEAKPEVNYRAGCGLGYELSEAPSLLEAPSVPVSVSIDGPRPTRLRYDELTKLLLVGDQSESAVRAFDVTGGTPIPRGVLLTGSPVRDFAVTPFVPETVLVEGALPQSTLSFPTDTVRYLYAIDDREGTLLVQRYEYDEAAQTVSGKPLLTHYSARYNDRLALGGSALALEVIDTRDLSVPACGVNIDEHRETDAAAVQRAPINQPVTLETPDDLTARIEKRSKTLAQLEKEKENTSAAEKYLLQARLQEAIYEEASSFQLRGVFLAVSTSAGTIRILDIHDIDVYCRGAQACGMGAGVRDPEDGQQHASTDLRSTSGALPVAIQRHAARLNLLADISVSLSDDDFMKPLDACPDGYRVVLDSERKDGRDARIEAAEDGAKALVCAPSEPWLSPSGVITLTYEGAIGALSGGGVTGYLVESGSDVVLQGAVGLDFCTRGISPKDARGKVSDVVAVVGEPSPGVKNCEPPVGQNPVLLSVKSAHVDHLVLDGADPDLAEVLRCYPDGITFQVRVQNEFIVSSSSVQFPTAVSSDANGECVVDPAHDARHTFRARPGEPFANPSLAFTIAVSSEGYERLDDYTLQMSLSADPLSFSVFNADQGRTDSLPVTLRYFPYTGDLFVIDTASQGLRRFGFAPFGTSSSGVR